MVDNLTKEQRHKNMQNIKSSGTRIEVTLRKALWARGFRYRKNYAMLPGTPDIVLNALLMAGCTHIDFLTLTTVPDGSSYFNFK